MNGKILPVIIAFAIAPQAANAAETIGTRGNWEIFRNANSCGMTRDYDVPGATEMVVIKYVDGKIRIMITNRDWSAKQGKLYDISYVLNGTSYGGAQAVGTADQGRKGFVSTFVADFADDFAQGSLLQVLLGEQQIERLSLDGSGAAMALVNQCLATARGDLAAAERERERRAQLPKDPFAAPPRKPPPKGK